MHIEVETAFSHVPVVIGLASPLLAVALGRQNAPIDRSGPNHTAVLLRLPYLLASVHLVTQRGLLKVHEYRVRAASSASTGPASKYS